MTKPTLGLATLQEQVAPLLSNSSETMGYAMGSVLMAGVESDSERQAAESVLGFAHRFIHEKDIDSHAANSHLLELASSIAARNWLKDSVETAEDNAVMASVVTGLFTAIDSSWLPAAGHTFRQLRGRFGPSNRMHDTTHRLLTVFAGSKLEPAAQGRMEANLSPHQLEQILAIQGRYNTPKLASPRAEFIGGRLVYVRD